MGSHGRIRYSGSPLPYRLQETVIAKQCSLVTLHPQKEAVVEDFYFDNPKPIEKWICKSYDEALKKCEENQNRPCYVYLQIYTDTYIREEQLKELKSRKEDILEVIPVFPETETPKKGTVFTEKSFLELFLDYYQKKKGVLPEEEIVETLQEILIKEDENEADFHENEGIK